MAEGLATRLLADDVQEALKDAEVFALDTGALLAGTRFRGDFEERFKAVVKALAARPKAILFIDEIHSTVGAGAVTGGTMDLATLMKPLLTAGELRVIGSTTFEEFKHIEKDRALARRLQKIAIDEPSIEETVQHSRRPARPLRGASQRQVHRRGARGRGEAGGAPSARLPAARQRDRSDRRSRRGDAAEGAAAIGRDAGAVDAADIEPIVARMARIPARQASSSDRERLRTLEESLERVVFGQHEAVHLVAQAIKRSRAGPGQPDRPAGCFLFTGPTGVGKTELAKQLALQLGNEFIRFDMSEYMEKHAVARLIGAPPGYVGFEQGGLLVDAVRTHPYSVVLLDEIEKAHPDIYNILLQVMDHATLTDNTGRKADFRNIVLILTSNAGSREMSAASIGFADEAAMRRAARPARRRRRSSACSARSSATGSTRSSPSGSLTPAAMETIVEKFVLQLEGQLADRHVAITLTPEARAWLATKGYDPVFGARPLGPRDSEGSARSADRRNPLRRARARRHGDDRRRRRPPCFHLRAAKARAGAVNRRDRRRHEFDERGLDVLIASRS